MMNNRIQELAKQAQIDGDAIHYYSQGFAKKFAELIVKECIDNIEVWELDSRNHISYMLARHFGVEE